MSTARPNRGGPAVPPEQLGPSTRARRRDYGRNLAVRFPHAHDVRPLGPPSKRDVRIDTVPDPAIQDATDVIIKVTTTGPSINYHAPPAPVVHDEPFPEPKQDFPRPPTDRFRRACTVDKERAWGRAEVLECTVRPRPLPDWRMPPVARAGFTSGLPCGGSR